MQEISKSGTIKDIVGLAKTKKTRSKHREKETIQNRNELGENCTTRQTHD